MSLRNICRSFAVSKSLPPRMPAEAATLRVARRLDAGEVAPTRPLEDELETACERIHAALALGSPISNRDLRRAPWCIFTTSRPLKDEPTLLAQLLNEIAARARIRIFRALATVYLHFFDPNSATIRLIADFLSEQLDRVGSPWKSAHEAAQIFSPQTAARRIASIALERGTSPDSVFESLGFVKMPALGALREHVYLLGLEELATRRDITPLKRLELVREWATEGKDLRFKQTRTPMANALLLPFDGAMPEKSIRDAYLAFLLPLIGDPRTNPKDWIGSDDAARIARRWLTELALRQFFDIVDKVAPLELWAYRRAFWGALEKEGYIGDAWVVFESQGASAARSAFGRNISFGTFGSYGGVQPGHSALLLRIGTLVVVEWSHNGKCRIWDENSGHKPPPMFQTTYRASELRKEVSQAGPTGQGVFIHHGSRNYHWQSQIAAFLKERRNIQLSKSSYELR